MHTFTIFRGYLGSTRDMHTFVYHNMEPAPKRLKTTKLHDPRQYPELHAEPHGRGKSWFYTLNNYTPEDEERLQSISCLYHVYGREIAPTTGTRHLQGCITFENTYRYPKAIKLLQAQNVDRVKFIDHARNYCMKDGDLFILDNRKPQGHRSDINDVCEHCSGGALDVM